MLETVEAIARISGARLVAQPNAGRPRDVEARNLYLCSPDYMASYARRFVAAGVKLVGGCCGTTPEHIRQIVSAVRASSPVERPRPTAPADGQPHPAAPIRRGEKSALALALEEGRFVVVAEVAAPRGLDLTATVAGARRLRDLGAVAVNIPDYPQSGARASALALSALIEHGQVETVLQYTCRDRTLLGMQSDLVGAHAMGVRNVLLTTGSPVPVGTYADATSVFEVDAIGLINMVTRLNHGQDIAGQPIGSPTRFHVGAAVNPFAADIVSEWRRLQFKVSAGAEFVVTPPILDLEGFEAVLGPLRQSGVPVLAGVAALEGLRHAEFLASEVVGSLLERLRAAKDETAEAMRITLELASRLKGLVQGLQITSFHGSPLTAERVLTALGGPTHA
jgi:homocysteine S-methyltransferase